MLIVFEVFLCSPADFLCGGWYVFSQKFDKLVELISLRFPSATALCRLLKKIEQRDLSLIIFRLQFLSAVSLLAGEFLQSISIGSLLINN